MKRKLLLTFLCAALLFGCTVQEAHLVYRPEPTSDPTAVPTATPDPVRLDIPAVTGEPFTATTRSFALKPALRAGDPKSVPATITPFV